MGNGIVSRSGEFLKLVQGTEEFLDIRKLAAELSDKGSETDHEPDDFSEDVPLPSLFDAEIQNESAQSLQLAFNRFLTGEGAGEKSLATGLDSVGEVVSGSSANKSWADWEEEARDYESKGDLANARKCWNEAAVALASLYNRQTVKDPAIAARVVVDCYLAGDASSAEQWLGAAGKNFNWQSLVVLGVPPRYRAVCFALAADNAPWNERSKLYEKAALAYEEFGDRATSAAFWEKAGFYCSDSIRGASCYWRAALIYKDLGESRIDDALRCCLKVVATDPKLQACSVTDSDLTWFIDQLMADGNKKTGDAAMIAYNALPVLFAKLAAPTDAYKSKVAGYYLDIAAKRQSSGAAKRDVLCWYDRAVTLAADDETKIRAYDARGRYLLSPASEFSRDYDGARADFAAEKALYDKKLASLTAAEKKAYANLLAQMAQAWLADRTPPVSSTNLKPLEEALELARRAVIYAEGDKSLFPQLGKAFETVADMYQRLSFTKEALDIYKQALKFYNAGQEDGPIETKEAADVAVKMYDCVKMLVVGTGNEPWHNSVSESTLNGKFNTADLLWVATRLNRAGKYYEKHGQFLDACKTYEKQNLLACKCFIREYVTWDPAVTNPPWEHGFRPTLLEVFGLRGGTTASGGRDIAGMPTGKDQKEDWAEAFSGMACLKGLLDKSADPTLRRAVLSHVEDFWDAARYYNRDVMSGCDWYYHNHQAEDAFAIYQAAGGTDSWDKFVNRNGHQVMPTDIYPR